MLASSNARLPAGKYRAAAAPSSGPVSSLSAMPALLMALSGFAGLGYQIVWTQQFGTWLGHEVVSVLAVIMAFFGGLALGAWGAGSVIARSPVPHRWYAGCEALMAVWAVVLAAWLPTANAYLASVTGVHPSPQWQWLIAFAGPFALLLPATVAMGATLPAMTGVTERLRREGFAIGGLYATNTLGAVAGVLGATFFLVPALGLTGTALVCAAMNATCAALALTCLTPRGSAAADANPALDAAPNAVRMGQEIKKNRVAVLLFLTGLLGIGYEVLVVRVLSQVTENTVFTFALLLAVYLLATAVGAACYQRWIARAAAGAAALPVGARLLQGVALAMFASIAALSASQGTARWLSLLLGVGVLPSLTTEFVLAAAAFALPSLAMGAVFSHLCVLGRIGKMSMGAALGLNTLGAALAPVLFGVVLLPLLGPQPVLVGIAAAYGLASLVLYRPLWRTAGTAAVGVIGLLLTAGSGSLTLVTLPEDGQLLSYRDGVMAAVSVTQDAAGVARLRINNRQQEGSSATGLLDARLAYLPLLMQAAPRSALFLGLGTGVTAAAAAEDARLTVDAVELVPEVVAASPYFVLPQKAATRPSGLQVMAGDARRFVRSPGRPYDVIVADLFHPGRSGSAALYTVEHFAAIRARLAPGGLFCQWLPLHQLDLGTLASIVQSFMQVYPQGIAVLANNSLDTPVLGLIARPDAPLLDWSAIDKRLSEESGQRRRQELRLDDGFALLGAVVAGPAALHQFAGRAPLNTDDRPVVAHRAALFTYEPPDHAQQRLLALLQRLQVAPDELLDPRSTPPDAAVMQRLQAYWSARQQFIQIGVGVKPSADPRVMLAQVHQPLLAVLATSADFRPAYDPLLAMAQALANTDPPLARQVLQDLNTLQPQRPEAGVLLARLALVPQAATVLRPQPTP